MPDVGTPLPRSTRPNSHTSTQQWQSFEVRMRYRRAERCVARAEAALGAGRDDEARAALDEARALNPETPPLEAVAAAVHQREAAARAAARRRQQRTAAAVAIILAVAAASFGFWLRTTGSVQRENAVDAMTTSAAPPASTSTSTTKPAAPPAQTPVQAVTPPAVLPSAERAVRTSGAEPAADPTTTSPPASPPASPAPALPPVQNVEPALKLDPPAPVGTAAMETAMPRPTGAGTLVGNLPSAGLPVVTIPPPAAAETGTPEAPIVSEETKVRAVLTRFEAAYSRLSAPAAQAVWPSVDVRALASAFESLESQQVSLGRCSIIVKGETARAECSGTTSWTPRVGGGRRSGARRWEFDLALEDGAWQILQATAR